MNLWQAMKHIHADPQWWRKILLGGALMCTVFGVPFAGGLVIESMDNARKGYPTPLPPWVEWSSRYIIGMFGFLIDFLFFVLPVLVSGILFFCGAVGILIFNADLLFNLMSQIISGALLTFWVVMFLLGVSPVGKLIYAEDGSPEQAMSTKTVREALRPGARGVYFRARLISLPAYLPVLAMIAATVALLQTPLPFGWLLILLSIWLTCSAILYGQLVVAQIYAAAEIELRRNGLDRTTVLMQADEGGSRGYR